MVKTWMLTGISPLHGCFGPSPIRRLGKVERHYYFPEQRERFGQTGRGPPRYRVCVLHFNRNTGIIPGLFVHWIFNARFRVN